MCINEAQIRQLFMTFVLLSSQCAVHDLQTLANNNNNNILYRIQTQYDISVKWTRQ